MRLLESLAVLALVSFFFIPVIREQKESLRLPPSGCGAFNPGLPGLALLYEARPLALSPPDFDWPSALVQAGVLAIIESPAVVATSFGFLQSHCQALQPHPHYLGQQQLHGRY